MTAEARLITGCFHRAAEEQKFVAVQSFVLCDFLFVVKDTARKNAGARNAVVVMSCQLTSL